MAVVAGLLALTSLLPHAAQWLTILAAIVLLGVPHGALDGEIARTLLRPRWSRAWFVVFALPYLALVACVLIAWRVAPLSTLAAFLAVSVVHFGLEDAGPKPLEAVVRGALPIAAPLLLHPAGTVHVFATVAMAQLAEPPAWLMAGACLWLGAALLWAAQRAWLRQWRVLVEPIGLVALFAVLPPLTAFGIYFVALHAPRHMGGLVGDPRAPRVRSLRDATALSLPLTAVTILIGALLWRWFPGAPPERMLSLTIQLLAALTLPHMLLDGISAAVSRHSARRRLAPWPAPVQSAVRGRLAGRHAGCRKRLAPGSVR